MFFVLFLTVQIPYGIIGSICAIVPILGMLGFIYFYRFWYSSRDKSDFFEDVIDEADRQYDVNTLDTNHSNEINNSPGNKSLNQKQDWTEMQNMPSPQSGKRGNYQRAGSKDSMEVSEFDSVFYIL